MGRHLQLLDMPARRPSSWTDDRMELTERLNRLSPVQIDGVPYAIWLLDIRMDPRSRGSLCEVKVAARNPSGRHYIGRFHIEAERLHDEGVARALKTMEFVVRGNLPPTAPEMPF
jgi:hypothetical protein